jgi:hypothetical protein
MTSSAGGLNYDRSNLLLSTVSRRDYGKAAVRPLLQLIETNWSFSMP